jgi:CRP/FNR family transcriptional regulator, cyclic AMP receptor protein
MNANTVTSHEWAEVLAKLPLFQGIRKRELRRIAGDAEISEFAPGEMVVATGERSNSFYVILGGEARPAWKPAGRPLRMGDYFGEIGLLDGGPRSGTVVATSDLHVMRMPRRTFDGVLERNPSIARRFLVELGSRVRELERQAVRGTI